MNSSDKWNELNIEEYSRDDVEDNLYVAKLFVVFGVIMLVIYVLNELGIFYVDNTSMRVTCSAGLVCVVAIQILGRVKSISSQRKAKYAIITIISLYTFLVMVMLNFHAVLTLCIPILLAINYHSRKLAVFSIVGSVICAVGAPLLGLLLGTWQYDYLAMLLWCIDPNFPGARILPELDTLKLSPYEMIALFISLPQMGYAIFFGFVIYASNRRKKKLYQQQLEDITDSRNKVLEGMANIVENRDIETGGHVKRTSEVMKILVDVLQGDERFEKMLNEEYCKNIVRTAPMHDLGKIAIPDAILNKPARLEPDEYEQIKIHPKKSFEIIYSVFSGLNDDTLLKTAENIALYHHEWYDGTGYPQGLRGEEIPFEARLMAIADVYDALVSERCYKEPMPHDKAFEEIRGSMGTHFDPQLWDCFVKAHPAIVEYYSKNTNDVIINPNIK